MMTIIDGDNWMKMMSVSKEEGTDLTNISLSFIPSVLEEAF